jgi:uncharacterized membrane protein (DUF373 family)
LPERGHNEALRNDGMKQKILRLYDMSIDLIVMGLMLVMLVTLGLAFADVLATLVQLIPGLSSIKLNDVEFRDLVSGVLGIFIVIELFSTFINYVRLRRIRLSALIDIAAVFILRDMIVKLYAQSVPNDDLLVLAVLLIVMVIARSITGLFPPKIHKDDAKS